MHYCLVYIKHNWLNYKVFLTHLSGSYLISTVFEIWLKLTFFSLGTLLVSGLLFQLYYVICKYLF